MIEAVNEESLDQPPEVVFDFLADVANEHRWNPDLLSVEQVTPGPPVLGSVRRGEYRHIGRIESTIVGFDRPGRLAFRVSAAQAEMEIEFHLNEMDGTAAGRGTHMRVVGKLQLKGALRFAEIGLRGAVTHQYAERARAIKRALDGSGEGSGDGTGGGSAQAQA